MLKIIVLTLVAFAVCIGGFYALNSYIYIEKQAETPTDIETSENVPEDIEEGVVAEDFEGEADPSVMTLPMNTWVWISALYNDEREIKPTKKDAFTLKFGSDGRFNATTDCNAIAGKYTTKNEMISFTDMISTKMFCEGSQETVFAELLTNTSSYHFTSRGELILDLKFDSGSVVFR